MSLLFWTSLPLYVTFPFLPWPAVTTRLFQSRFSSSFCFTCINFPFTSLLLQQFLLVLWNRNSMARDFGLSGQCTDILFNLKWRICLLFRFMDFVTFYFVINVLCTWLEEMGKARKLLHFTREPEKFKAPKNIHKYSLRSLLRVLFTVCSGISISNSWNFSLNWED